MTPTSTTRRRSDPGKAAGDRAVNFFCKRLHHTKGSRLAGHRFVPDPWQASWLREVFGTLRPDGQRQYTTAYLEIPKKNGKALALDTPIPTPTGWTTMGGLSVGDEVFADDGKLCSVLYGTEDFIGRDCYRVTLTDGTSVVCDAGHLWQVDVLTREYQPDVLTTELMRGRVSTRSDGALNYRLPLAGVLDCEYTALPFPAYALGAWLGDGSTAEAHITLHDDDVEVIEHIRSLGITVKRSQHGERTPRFSMVGNGTSYQNRGNCPRSSLRKIGVLGDKHIPVAYLRSSHADRMELLRGLMDTDGTVSQAGQCSFTTTSRALLDGIMELLRTLGFKPTANERRAVLDGRDCGPCYTVQFWAWSDWPCFRLARKAARLRERPQGQPRSMTRHICAIERVASVPVRCIQVDAPSHLYLAGEGMVPTHNTTMTAGCLLKCLFDENEIGGEVYSCAAKRDQAGKLFEIMAAMVRKCPALDVFRGVKTKIYDREKRIYVPKLDSYYQALSSDANVEDGINPSAAAVDELHRHRSRDLLEVVEEGMVARDNPLLFILTTAGGDQMGPAWEVHEHALAVLADPAIDPSFHATVYAAEEGADPGDEAAWLACNPALAAGAIDIEKVRGTFRKAQRSPTKMRSFKRLRLNWWIAGDDKWLDVDEWKACGMDVAPIDPLREWAGRKCWGGLDISSTSDFTALAWLFSRDDGGFDLWVQFFYAKGSVAKRARMSDAVQEWADRGLITLTPSDSIDYAYVAQAVRRGFEAFDVQELGYDPWHAPNVINEPCLADVPVVMTKVSQYASVMNAPCRKLETLIAERTIHHYGNPVLRWMATNAVAETNAYEAMRPAKNKTKDKIDGLTATIIALERAMAPQAAKGFSGVVAV